FEKLRVSESRIGFEYHFGNGFNAALFEGVAYGAGTLTNNTTVGTTELNTTTASGTGYWIQQYSPPVYGPGVGNTIRMTFGFNTPQANVTQRLGVFTDQGTFP